MTGNDRSPTVASRVGGTTKVEVDDDRKHRPPGIPATGYIGQVDRPKSMSALEDQNC